MHSGASHDYPCSSTASPDTHGATANAAHNHHGLDARYLPARYPVFDSPMATSAQQDISDRHPAPQLADYSCSPSTTLVEAVRPFEQQPHPAYQQPFATSFHSPSELSLPPIANATAYHGSLASAVHHHSASFHTPEQQRHSRFGYFSPRTSSVSSLSPQNGYLPTLSYASTAPRMLSSFAEPPVQTPQNFPWPENRNHVDDGLTCEGQIVTPTIVARMEKGFTKINNYWTCYRRNYFEVTCAYHLSPFCQGSTILLRGKPVKALGLGIGAVVQDRDLCTEDSRPVDILQFTPKRNANDRRDLNIVKVWPGLPMNTISTQHRLGYFGTSRAPTVVPSLPYQDNTAREDSPNPGVHRYSNDALPLVDNAQDGLYKQHTFDRLQFKTATANNGKRRASQQYYRLRISLYADMREDGELEPRWIKVCEILSEPLVVRGRSPNHYKLEDSGQDADERGGSEPGPSGDTTPAFGHPLFGYTHHSYSPDESRSRTNIGGFRGYNGNEYAGGRSSDASLTPPDHEYFQQLGDDVRNEIHGDMISGTITGYTYGPGPLYEPLSGPLRADAQYQDPSIRSAFRAEFPRSLQGNRWAFECMDPMRTFTSSTGFYPPGILDISSDLDGSQTRALDTPFQYGNSSSD